MMEHATNGAPAAAAGSLPPPSRSRMGARARGRADGWRAVRVESVDVRDVTDPGEADGRRLVRARIHLGRLCPADVYVHAVPARAGADPQRTVSLARLWSVQSYGNGTYVFETHLPTVERSGSLRVEVARREDMAGDASRGAPVARSRAVTAGGRRTAD